MIANVYAKLHANLSHLREPLTLHGNFARNITSFYDIDMLRTPNRVELTIPPETPLPHQKFRTAAAGQRSFEEAAKGKQRYRKMLEKRLIESKGAIVGSLLDGFQPYGPTAPPIAEQLRGLSFLEEPVKAEVPSLTTKNTRKETESKIAQLASEYKASRTGELSPATLSIVYNTDGVSIKTISLGFKKLEIRGDGGVTDAESGYEVYDPSKHGVTYLTLLVINTVDLINELMGEGKILSSDALQ